MKRFLRLLPCLAILAVLMAACQSTKQAVSGEKAGTQAAAVARRNIENRFSATCYSSKVRIEITGKGERITANGSLKIRKGRMVQLSITPLLGIEIARIELTPDTLLVIDRFNKQYVQVPLERLGFPGHAGHAFQALQGLFLNQLFLPGKDRELTLSDIRQFSFRQEEGRVVAVPKRKGNGTSCSFQLDSEGRLTATCVHLPKECRLAWEYGHFTATGSGYFPSEMRVALQSGAFTVQVGISHSRISTKDFAARPSAISPKYKPLDVGGLLEIISGL